MKKIFGKNRLAILSLAVMIGVAGYMSFADADKDKKKAEKDGEKQVEVLSYEDQSEPDTVETEAKEVSTGNVELNGPESTIGDAVLTSAQVAGSMAQAKLTREQSRSKSREALMDVISDEALGDAAKKEATDTYVKLSDTIEKETDVETLLAARGYEDAIVTIGDSSVDVALGTGKISDEERAQIEDIVTRKTGYNISEIAISVMEDK